MPYMRCIELHISDLKWFVCFNRMKKAFINFPKVLIIKDRIDCLSCCKDWKSISSCDNTKSLDMIRILMCDQNSIKFWNGKIKFLKGIFNTLCTDSTIN